MPVKVSFMRPGFVGSVSILGLGRCRVSETITVPGSTTAAALDGEIVLLCSTEAVAVVVAHGITPDAAAVVSTPATTAGYALAPLSIVPVAMLAGDKVNIKAFV